VKRARRARPAAPAPERDPREAIARSLGEPGRTEAWAWVAYGVLAVTALLYAYLGLRTGGRGPLLAWRYGRDACFVAAFATLFWALAQSVMHRPFLQRARARGWVALALVIGVTPFPFPYPSSHEGKPSSVAFRLPVEGTWRVLWGGEERDANRLAGFFAEQRWALALVRDESGRRLRADAPAAASDTRPPPEAYLAFGEPIVAPASGTVAWVRDGLVDGDLAIARDGVPALGNVVVIEVAPDEHVFLAHLQQGSITVAAGERVEIGTPVARAGASGFSRLVPEPHVLTFLQDSADEGAGEPIPWLFHGYFAGDRFVERGLPAGGITPDRRLAGQLVRHAEGG
jgi:hypothetical protein